MSFSLPYLSNISARASLVQCENGRFLTNSLFFSVVIAYLNVGLVFLDEYRDRNIGLPSRAVLSCFRASSTDSCVKYLLLAMIRTVDSTNVISIALPTKLSCPYSQLIQKLIYEGQYLLNDENIVTDVVMLYFNSMCSKFSPNFKYYILK